MSDNLDATPVPGPRLLPHERLFAGWILRRQRSHRTAAIERAEANYGPSGIALMAASLSTALPASAITITGIVLLFVSRAEGVLGAVAYVLICVGGTVALMAAVRALQAGRTGRAFRGDQPFQR